MSKRGFFLTSEILRKLGGESCYRSKVGSGKSGLESSERRAGGIKGEDV